MRNVVPVPTPAEGNDCYPLPPDYFSSSFSEEDRRVARINATRQWLLKTRDPALAGLRAIESLRFFDLWYLHADEGADFDPLFYDDEPRVTPDFHWHIRSLMAQHRFLMGVAPRGAAKSTLFKKIGMHANVTRPQMKVVYATSTIPNAKTVGMETKDSIYNNDRIFDDFAKEDEFGGRIKPSRNELPTGNEFYSLANRSWMCMTSAESRQRGKRPRLYILDDPEYDPDESTDVSVLREGLQYLLFRVIMPMMLRKDVNCAWIGTFVSKQHLLYRAMEVEERDGKRYSKFDARLDHWARVSVPITYNDEQGVRRSCWPDMWPLTIEERDSDPRLEGLVAVEEMPEYMGPAEFAAEMEGRPGDKIGVGFPPLNEDRHGYHWEDVDDAFPISPLNSDAKLVYKHNEERVELSMIELVNNSTRIVTIDTAYTNGSASDWKVATVLAMIVSQGILIPLDMYHTRDDQNVLVERVIDLAIKWRASMFPEAIRRGENLFRALQQQASLRAVTSPDAVIPGVKPFRPGREGKTEKIDALTYRFEHGLIKLPMYARQTDPWRELFHQIENFNPRARDGGLGHDDHVDTVAMGHMILRGKRGQIQRTELDRAYTNTKEAVLDGNLKTPDGLSLVPGVFNEMSLSEIARVMEIQNDRRTESDESHQSIV